VTAACRPVHRVAGALDKTLQPSAIPGTALKILVPICHDGASSSRQSFRCQIDAWPAVVRSFFDLLGEIVAISCKLLGIYRRAVNKSFTAVGDTA
jgi:hypothetical protein